MTEYTSTIQDFSIEITPSQPIQQPQPQQPQSHALQKQDTTKLDRRQQSRQELQSLLGSLRAMTQQELQEYKNKK